MRARIAAPLLLVLVLAAVALLVPLLVTTADQRTAELGLERRTAVERVTDLARAAVEDGEPTALRRHVERYHEVFGEAVLVVDSGGSVLAASGGLDPADVEVARRIRDFGYNLPDLEIATVYPWSPASTLISTPVQIERDLSSGAVVMQVDLRAARADVRDDWLRALLPAVVLLLLLGLAIRWGTRWILRPVDELDEATHALASGERHPDVVVTGPPELRRLARSFRAMADTLSATLDQQRDLVANTSHQLRNPLAAVRLHVDLLSDSAGGPGGPAIDPDALEAVQRDLDRLDATVDRLLGMADAEHRVSERAADRVLRDGAAPVPAAVSAAALRTLVSQRWDGAGGPRVSVRGDTDLVVAVPPHDVGEMVDTLVDNAAKYAGTDADVHVWLEPGATEGELVLRVDDDGDGLSDADLEHVGTRFWRSSRHAVQPGTGLGLALVEALARANGGSMQMGRSARGGLDVALRLPRATESPSVEVL